MTPRKPASSPDTSHEFFDQLYRNLNDPWNFRNSVYERERYHAIVECIGDREYESAFEPGCAIGELTRLLAPYCNTLDALDCSITAVQRARTRCREYPQVNVRQGALPGDLPTKNTDLIVVSEVGYYFTPVELASLVAQLWSKLRVGGRLVACHWLGHSNDHWLHGAEVHQLIREVLNKSENYTAPSQEYVLQRWQKD